MSISIFGFNIDIDLIAVALVSLRIVLILVVALVLLIIIRKTIPRLVKMRIPRIHEESKNELALRSDTISKVIVKVFNIIVWIIAFIMILSTLGLNITPIIAGIGVGAIAVAFAAQNIIRDYMHGLFIVMEDWYRVGEVVNIAGIGGIVADIDLRRTVLRDLEGTMHVIPNSKIELASNMTRDWSRINLDIAVAYGENIDNCIRVINEVCQGLKDDALWGPDLLTTPQVLRVDSLSDNGVVIKILGDTKPIKQWALTGELRKRLKNRFDQEGIEIPWPHTKVYFGNELTGTRLPS